MALALVLAGAVLLPGAVATAATTTYCLGAAGQFTSCPSIARTLLPTEAVPTTTTPSSPGAPSLPFSAPALPRSHPAEIFDSGISIGPEHRPVIVGVVLASFAAVAAGSVIVVRRRRHAGGLRS